MDDAEFERLSAEILDGATPDWDQLERETPPAKRERLEALCAIAQVSAASRERLGHRTPERWGAYDLIEPVGHGGYGEVWRAHDPHLDRDIALKIIPAEDEDVEDVLREGRLLARVRHPHVAAIYGASRIDREIGVAMEFIDGEDLETIVRRSGALTAQEVITIGLQLARAIEAVHRAGVLHRDIKASNVKRTEDGRAILLDFGSSRELRLHTTNVDEAGTPLYVAPEVLAGGAATVQSDLYSLGALLYFLATGRHPIEATSFEELRAKHTTRSRGAAALDDRPRLPRKLAGVLNHLLAPTPAHRPRTAAFVAARLSRRWPRRVVAAAAAVVVVAGAGAFGARFLGRTSGFGLIPTDTERRLQFAIAPATIGRPSLDGRILPFVDRRNGGLAIMHVDSGAIDLLTTDSDVVERFAGVAIASPDGGQIAYEWAGDAMHDEELRILDVATRRVRTIWHTPDDRTSVEPTAWAHDGSRIAGVIEGPGDTKRLFVIGLGDAAPRLFEAGGAAWPSFSDDDRLLVFQRQDPTSGLFGLWLLNLSDGGVHQVNIVGSNEQTPIWSAGQLTFVSERDGTSALWWVTIDPSGRVTGLPTEIPDSQGVVILLGVAADGSVLCRRTEGTSQVIVANLDGSQPQQVSTGPGGHFSPDWSADGRQIAYLTEPLQGPLRHFLTIHDIATRKEQRFDSLGQSFGKPGGIGYNPRLSPDGQRVLLRSPRGFFVYDFNSRTESRPYFGGRHYGDVEWDDDSHVFVMEFDRGISLVDLETGGETRVYSLPAGRTMGRGIAVSPNRTRVAFVTEAAPAAREATLSVVNRDGSAERALLTKTRPRPYGAVPMFAAIPLLLGQWTADGRDVLFASTDVLPNGFTKWETDLWAVPADGGAPYETGLSALGLRDIRPNPDGGRIAYTLFTFHADVVSLPRPKQSSTPLR